jgi:hypothetical protein
VIGWSGGRPLHSSRPSQALRAPGRCLLLWGGQDALPLREFPRSLAGAADPFRFLASLSLRRLLIEAAALHLAEDSFALHLSLQRLQRLLDVVVAYEYLQSEVSFHRLAQMHPLRPRTRETGRNGNHVGIAKANSTLSVTSKYSLAAFFAALP